MPIPPVILASLLSSAPALIQSGVQFGKSLGEEDLTRPDLSIPESAKEALGIQRTLASNRNPMGYEAAINKIDQSINNAITGVRNAGGSLTDKMSAIADLNMKRGMALSDLDISAGKDYVSRLSSLTSGLNNYAAQEARIQQDELQKFQAESAARLARDTAAKQNLQNAMGAIGQGVATNIAFNQNMDLMAKQFANQKELEQMKLDAYRSMLSGGSNQGQNTNQTVNPQVAQSDASVSTGVLAPTGGEMNTLPDNALASLFPYLNQNVPNQSLNGPLDTENPEFNINTGVVRSYNNQVENQASLFPYVNNGFNSNLGPTQPIVDQSVNSPVIPYTKTDLGVDKGGFYANQDLSSEPIVKDVNSLSSIQSATNGNQNLGINKGGFYPSNEIDINYQLQNKKNYDVNRFTNLTNNLIYDKENKTLYLPKNFNRNAMNDIDQTYLDYLRNKYKGYTIR